MADDPLLDAYSHLVHHGPPPDEGLEGMGPDPVGVLSEALESDFEDTNRRLVELEYEGHDAFGEVWIPPLELDESPDDPSAEEGLEAMPGLPGGMTVRPRDLSELQEQIRGAGTQGWRVRPRGGMHSFSGINQGDALTIDMLGLHRRRVIDPDLLTERGRGLDLVRVMGGTRVEAIIDHLVDRGRALANTGNYARQAIAGALATDTHGTGLGLGPFSSLTEALLVVDGAGKVHRIERSDSITDRDALKARFPNLGFEADDDTFNALVVGLGRPAVTFSLTMTTTREYWLQESRKAYPWSVVKARILAGDWVTAEDRVSIAINPYRIDGDHLCLVTRRTVMPEIPRSRGFNKRTRNFFAWVASNSRFAGSIASRRLGPKDKRGTVIQDTLPLIEDKVFQGRWDRVLITGPPAVRAESAEYGVPFEPRVRAMRAVEDVFAMLDPKQNRRSFWPTSPINLRFVGASDALISPMYGRPTMMIEVPFLDWQLTESDEKLDDTLRGLERHLIETFEGRPHWGKRFYLDQGHDLGQLYPRLDTWKAVRDRFDPDGRFRNKVTDRVGL